MHSIRSMNASRNAWRDFERRGTREGAGLSSGCERSDIASTRIASSSSPPAARSAGGVTSIAHPTLYPNGAAIVPELLDAGIDGVEVFHPEVDEASRESYSNVARFRGKMLTGGSDDHGTVKQVQTLGTVRVPENLIGPILERL